MIFAIDGHINQIVEGSKTQTRRPHDQYKVGKDYAIQRGRGQRAEPIGRIKIKFAIKEVKQLGYFPIHPNNAKAEGGYAPEVFEALYEQMYPKWTVRYAYSFEFVPRDYKKEVWHQLVGFQKKLRQLKKELREIQELEPPKPDDVKGFKYDSEYFILKNTVEKLNMLEDEIKFIREYIHENYNLKC